MAKADLSRFYYLSEFFGDDERIIAFAVFDFIGVSTPEEIYKDLLSCHYKKWNDHIQKVIDTKTYEEIQAYIGQKQWELDMMNSHFWSCGDTAMIEKAGWKLNNEDEDDEF